MFAHFRYFRQGSFMRGATSFKELHSPALVALSRGPTSCVTKSRRTLLHAISHRTTEELILSVESLPHMTLDYTKFKPQYLCFALRSQNEDSVEGNHICPVPVNSPTHTPTTGHRDGQPGEPLDHVL